MTRKQLKRRWFEENAQLGRELGYPECCIKSFGNNPPELMRGKPSKAQIMRFDAAHIDGEFTGFIPCEYHANLILRGKIKLQDLIKNRSKHFPKFPNYGK